MQKFSLRHIIIRKQLTTTFKKCVKNVRNSCLATTNTYLMHKLISADNCGSFCRQLYCSKVCKLWVFTVHFLLPSKIDFRYIWYQIHFTFQIHLVLINCSNQLTIIQYLEGDSSDVRCLTSMFLK